MSRPAGSKNKPKALEDLIPDATKLIKGVVVAPMAPGISDLVQGERRKTIRYDAQFGIRALREGQFKGLWELVRIDNEGKRTIIMDASTRQSIIVMVNRQIMKIIIG